MEKGISRIFRTGFAYALEALILELEKGGVPLTVDEKKLRHKVLLGEKLDWNACRLYQDRFASYFNNCCLPPALYSEYRDTIFTGAPHETPDSELPG